MKKTVFLLCALTSLAALAEGIVLLQIPVDPWRLGVLLESLALLLAAFVGLTYSSVVRQLRQWALHSAWIAVAVPFVLLIPYLVYALGTRTFSFSAAGKLMAYIGVPTVLLLPDRLHRGDSIGWRDFAAMLALAVPVAGNWLEGIWIWPQELYVYRPMFCACVGAYGFTVIRNLEGVGFRLLWRKADAIDGLTNFLAFSMLGIPLGLLLSFIHPHFTGESLWQVPLQFVGIYLTIAIPEELLFRGILQNLLVRSIQGARRGLWGLLIASGVFGVSHLHHAPFPNWRYALLATLAGIFYGNAYRTRQRLSASALTHALVDTAWHFWF